MSRLIDFYKKQFKIIRTIAFLALVCLAWSNRFIQDDAFISFRYAEYFINGNGLVWNVGERIEGYTNFLWTLLVSGGLFYGFEPITFTYLLGMVFFLISLTFTYKLSHLILKSEDISLLTVILLGTNYTFSAYATGGLETQMQTALFVASSFLCLESVVLKEWTIKKLALLSSLLTASLLTRLDSALLCIVLFSVALISLVREKTETQQKFKKLLVLSGPCAVVIGAWFVWKLSYYGNILPNSFYIKVASPTSYERGLNYLSLFSESYFLFPFLLIGLFSLKALFKKSNPPILVLCLIMLLWTLYIVKVGGDFMEFRFLVPILPFLFMLMSWLMFAFIRDAWIRVALIAMIAIGVFHHVTTFAYTPDDGVEPVWQLHGHLYDNDQNWAGIGKVLGEAFNGNPDVIIATTAAGAIPYYSGLPTVDMFGINDSWVAKAGYYIGTTPGHQRISPINYLIERKVNLVVSHPLVIPMDAPVEHFPYLPKTPQDNLAGVRMVTIPLDQEYKAVVLYLTKSPVVDEVIRKNKWKVYRVIFKS